MTACGNSQNNKSDKTSAAGSQTESSSAESKTEDTKQESSFTANRKIPNQKKCIPFT